MSLCCVCCSEYLCPTITQVPTTQASLTGHVLRCWQFLLKLLLCKGFKPLAYCLLVMFSMFLQGLSDSRLEKAQSLLHCFKSTKGKDCMPVVLHCGAASDHKVQTSACPVFSSIIKSVISGFKTSGRPPEFRRLLDCKSPATLVITVCS